MKIISLTKGKQTIVSDDDYEYLIRWKWYFKDGYAATNMVSADRKRSTIRMHRLLLRTPPGFDTDHINGDKLDNRRENLRVATRGQNQWNRKKQNGTSKYKGIYWNRQNCKWHVQLQVNKKKIWLGYYDNEEDAYAAYQDAAAKYHGMFTKQ